MDQPKIERVLRLMQLLSGSRRYTIEELAERLDMSARTIYRYIDTFKAVGYVVRKEGGVQGFVLTTEGAKIVGSEELGIRN